MEKSGVTQNWWIGLSLLHTLFSKEHNAIVDRLRLEYPYWSGEELYQTARLVNAALIATIHTVEWTPAILDHPTLHQAMNINWWGCSRSGSPRSSGASARMTRGAGSWAGTPSTTRPPSPSPRSSSPSIACTRSCPTPSGSTACATGSFAREVGIVDVAGANVRRAFDGGLTPVDVCYSFGIENPGALVLHNFPSFLRDLERVDPDGTRSRIDLASVDVMRDRERGVRRYNDFRRLLRMPPVRTFAELTSNAAWARELAEVYGDVERVDLLVGALAEDPPGRVRVQRHGLPGVHPHGLTPAEE